MKRAIIESLEPRLMLSASITIAKPGVDVFKIDDDSTYPPSSFNSDGSLRIGDGSNEEISPVYRFSVPRFGNLTQIALVVSGQEYHWPSGGTDVQVRVSGTNWVTLGTITGSGFSSSTDNTSYWLSGDVDAGVVDLLDFRFVNEGWDDLRLDGLEVTLTYDGVSQFHLESFQELYGLYQEANDYWLNYGQHISVAGYEDYVVRQALLETAVSSLKSGMSSLIVAGGYDLLGVAVPSYLTKAAALAKFAHQQVDEMHGLLEFDHWVQEQYDLVYFPLPVVGGGGGASDAMEGVSQLSSESISVLLSLAQTWHGACTNDAIDVDEYAQIQSGITAAQAKLTSLNSHVNAYAECVGSYDAGLYPPVDLSTKKFLMSFVSSLTADTVDDYGNIDSGGDAWAEIADGYLEDLGQRARPPDPPLAPVIGAKTSPDGSTIQPGVWQGDADPYFHWSPPQSELPIEGYSINLGSPPDNEIDIYTTTWQVPTEGLTDGTHVFYAKARSASGWGPPGSFTIKVDRAAPTGSVSIASVPEYDGNSNTLDTPWIRIAPSASDSHSGVSARRWRIAGTDWSDWAGYSSSPFDIAVPQSIIDYALTHGRQVSVDIQYRDAAGNPSDTYSASLTIRGPQTYVVNSLLDTVANDGALTLREALNASNANAPVTDAPAGSPFETDTIIFDSRLFMPGQPSTIMLGGELSIRDSLNLVGPGSELLTLVAEADFSSRVFYVLAGKPVALEGLTISGGWTTEGGGIYVTSSTLNVTNVALIGNYATRTGGGIYAHDCMLNVINTTLTDNSAWDSAGGIYLFESTLNLINSSMVRNMAECDQGGGIYASGSTLNLADSTLSNSYAGGQGGAIYASGSTLNLTNATLSRGLAEISGGGIYATECSVNLLNTMLMGNTARYSGGGVYAGGRSCARLINVTLVGNTARYSGGGVYSGSDTCLTGATLVANSANVGGGIYASGSALNLANTIVVASNDGGEVYGSWQGSYNLIGVDPGFLRNPSPGTDGLWGTEDDDYGALRPTAFSPAVNAGSNTLAVLPDGTPLASDLGGSARISDGTVDIGAYEYQGAPAPGRETPSLVVNTLEDRLDLYDGVISLRDAIYYAGKPGLDSGITFASTLVNGTIRLSGYALWIDKPLEINGSGAGQITLDGDRRSRVMTLGQGANEVSMSHLIITGGTASYNGGGICVYKGNSLNLTATTIVGNTAMNCGGGIYAYYSSTLTLIGTTLSENLASCGGGVFASNNTMTVINTSLVGNRATSVGGGIYGSAMTLTNTTITGNAAGDYGGGIYGTSYGTSILVNTIVALNDGNEISGSWQGSNNVIDVDPGFIRNPSSGSDGLWGTEDDDHGDLRLRQDSPCIDAGDNAAVPADWLDLDADGDTAEPLPVDLDSQPRFWNALNVPDTGAGTAPIVDIGAYEAKGLRLGDADGNGRVTGADFIYWQSNYPMASGAVWSQGDFNGDGAITGGDFILWQSAYDPAAAAPAAPAVVTAGEEQASTAVASDVPELDLLAMPPAEVSQPAAQPVSASRRLAEWDASTAISRPASGGILSPGRARGLRRWSGPAEVRDVLAGAGGLFEVP